MAYAGVGGCVLAGSRPPPFLSLPSPRVGLSPFNSIAIDLGRVRKGGGVKGCHTHDWNWSLLKIQFPFVIFLAPKFVYNILSLPLFSMSLAQIKLGGGREREKGNGILFFLILPLVSWVSLLVCLGWNLVFAGCVCVCLSDYAREKRTVTNWHVCTGQMVFLTTTGISNSVPEKKVC